MRLFFSPVLLICAVAFFFQAGCIALKKDVEVARAQATAQSAARQKVLEETLRGEISLLNQRLQKIEQKLDLNKTAQENKLNLSFSTLDELKATIRDISNRIDAVDVGTAKATAGILPTIERMSERLDAMAHEMNTLRSELEERRPVEQVTIDGKGAVRIPDDPEKAYEQLVRMSFDAAIAPKVREGWALYRRRFPGRYLCESIYQEGRTFYAEKAWNSAIEQFRKIDTEHKGCSQHESSYLMTAWALYNMGKKDYAKKVVEGMRQLFPKSANPDQVADLEKRLGMTPRADKKKVEQKEPASKKAPAETKKKSEQEKKP